MSSKNSLEAMPDEILLNILGNFKLTLHEDESYGFSLSQPDLKRGLISLSTCSKHLHELTTSFLFHTVVQSNSHAIPALVKLLLAKPQLGRHIKKLYSDQAVDKFQVVDFAEDDFVCYHNIICEAAIATQIDLTDFLKNRDWNLYVSLLLCNAPNIEEIQFFGQNQEDRSHVFIEAVLAEAALLQKDKSSSDLSLSSLRSASIYFWGYEACGHGVDAILPYLNLKSMETIRANKLILFELDEVNQSPIYHLKDLDIDGALDGDKAIEYLSCFKSLERLKYVHERSELGYADFLPEKWGEAIAHLTPTLQRLEIGGDTDDNSQSIPGALGSLAKFKCLKELITDVHILLGSATGDDGFKLVKLVEILPRSLECLELSMCGPELVEQMMELLARKDECVPFLKKVVVEFHHRYSTDTGLEVVLRDMCGASKVALEFSSPSRPRYPVPETVWNEGYLEELAERDKYYDEGDE